ncbi:hypothetical protein [Agarilytica rhodophyticola]|uniref:hypothetical protein n=1 Tax=Agarilytica rhodophyticola TaxID=1737490 RepID=UPI000B3470BE|nr:hypothetical protein [Agarilytica rhodophyticola]
MKKNLYLILFFISCTVSASDVGLPSQTLDLSDSPFPLIQNCNNCQIPAHHIPNVSAKAKMPGMAGNHLGLPLNSVSLYVATIKSQKKTIKKLKLKIRLLEIKIKDLEDE